MKTRRLLALVSMLSLATPAFGQSFKGDFVDSQLSPFNGLGSGLKKVQEPLACKAPRSRFFSRSQSSLISFFQNTSCQTAGREILGELLTEVSCNMVNSCFKEKELPLNQKERERLDAEFMGFMIRENLSAEFNKYQSTESRDLRDLFSYIDKMPEEYKKQIRFCPEYKPSTEKCLNEDGFDEMAKLYFTSLNSAEIQRTDFKSLGKTATLVKPQMLMEPKRNVLSDIGYLQGLASDGAPNSFDLWRSGLNQQWNARKSAQLLKSTLDKSTAQTDFIGHVNLEKDWADVIKKNSNSFDPLEDKLLNSLSVAVALDGAVIPENELKDRVKKALIKFIHDGDDLILSYKKNDNAKIEKLIDQMSFKTEDFTSADRRSLSKKMNGLRVQLANEAFESDCAKTVISLGQMCSKVSENLKDGKINGVTVKNENLFAAMKESYKKTNPSPEELEKRSEFYDKMGMAQDQVYGKYATLIFNVNSCKEKFPGTIDISEKSKEAAREFIDQETRNVQHNKETAAKHIAAIVEKDEGFKKELSKTGFNLDIFKKDKLFADNSFQSVSKDVDHKSPVNAFDKIDTTVKPVNNAISSQVMNQNFAAPNPNSGTQNNYNFMNAPLVDQSAQNKAPVNPLEEKLKALEKKEKTLRRKISSGASAESEQDEQSDELAALRRQIEELKQEKAAATPKKSDQDSRIASGNGESQSASGAPGTDRPASLKISADNSAGETARKEEAAAVRSMAASQGADFAADSGAGAVGAAGRNPASTGAGGSASGKAGAEKLGGGLVLTKNGELALDPTTILENPNEGDIALVMEKTKGEPFIIRENGELVKVAPVLDAKGKLVLSSEGKIKFKKIKLTKAQQELIVKESNVNKAAKEVGVEPVRLYKLKSLLKEVRR